METRGWCLGAKFEAVSGLHVLLFSAWIVMCYRRYILGRRGTAYPKFIPFSTGRTHPKFGLEVKGTKTLCPLRTRLRAVPGPEFCGLAHSTSAGCWSSPLTMDCVLPFNHGRMYWGALLAGILTFTPFPPQPGNFCRTQPMTKGVRCIHSGHGLRMQ